MDKNASFYWASTKLYKYLDKYTKRKLFISIDNGVSLNTTKNNLFADSKFINNPGMKINFTVKRADIESNVKVVFDFEYYELTRFVSDIKKCLKNKSWDQPLLFAKESKRTINISSDNENHDRFKLDFIDPSSEAQKATIKINLSDFVYIIQLCENIINDYTTIQFNSMNSIFSQRILDQQEDLFTTQKQIAFDIQHILKNISISMNKKDIDIKTDVDVPKNNNILKIIEENEDEMTLSSDEDFIEEDDNSREKISNIQKMFDDELTTEKLNEISIDIPEINDFRDNQIEIDQRCSFTSMFLQNDISKLFIWLTAFTMSNNKSEISSFTPCITICRKSFLSNNIIKSLIDVDNFYWSEYYNVYIMKKIENDNFKGENKDYLPFNKKLSFEKSEMTEDGQLYKFIVELVSVVIILSFIYSKIKTKDNYNVSEVKTAITFIKTVFYDLIKLFSTYPNIKADINKKTLELINNGFVSNNSDYNKFQFDEKMIETISNVFITKMANDTNFIDDPEDNKIRDLVDEGLLLPNIDNMFIKEEDIIKAFETASDEKDSLEINLNDIPAASDETEELSEEFDYSALFEN